VRFRNNRILRECIEDAIDIIKDYQLPYGPDIAVRIALQLFERRATHVSVIMDAVLKQKTFRVGDSNPE
jgi:hypothetical protein